jgi:nucleoside-diphosphate-sugar epimerase
MSYKALVTGATGFIGSHLVEHLTAKRWAVTCLLREKSDSRILQTLPVDLIRGRTDDPEILEKAVQGQDFVFHLAGRIRSAAKKVYDKANRQLTEDLASACIRRNRSLLRFVYISSISAAGPTPLGQFADEEDLPSPNSEYGRSKLRAEQALQRLATQIPVTIIRPPNVYGPCQQETEALIKIIEKRMVPFLRERDCQISLIYVKDLILGVVKAAVSEKTINQIYYLTDGRAYSWREIILALKRALLKDRLFLPLPEGLIFSSAWLADILNRTGLIRIDFGRRVWKAMTQTPWLFLSSKAERDFGFRALFALEEGIKETVEYYQDHPRFEASQIP